MTAVEFPAGLPTLAPVVDPATQPYWDAAERGVLVVPRCAGCDRSFWYPRAFCPRCGSTAVEWPESPGAGEVYTWTVVRRAGGAWSGAVPFVLAYVRLDEGVVVQANLVDCSSDDVHVGARVAACFERQAEDDLPVLRFRPAPGPV